MNPLTKTSVKLYSLFLVGFVIMLVALGSAVFTQSRAVEASYSEAFAEQVYPTLSYSSYYLRFSSIDLYDNHPAKTLSFIRETERLSSIVGNFNTLIFSGVLLGLIVIMYGNMFFLKSGSYGMFYNLIPVKRSFYYRNHFIFLYAAFLLTYLINAVFMYSITRGAAAVIHTASGGIDFFGSYCSMLNYHYSFIFLAISIFGFFTILMWSNIAAAVCSVCTLVLPIVTIIIVIDLIESVASTRFILYSNSVFESLYSVYKGSIVFRPLGIFFNIRGFSSFVQPEYAQYINTYLLAPVLTIGLAFTLWGRSLFLNAQFLSYRFFHFPKAHRFFKAVFIPIGILFAFYFTRRWFV